MAGNVVLVGAANLFQHKVRLFAALSGVAVAMFLLVLQYKSLTRSATRVSALYNFFNFDIALVPDTFQILISPGDARPRAPRPSAHAVRGGAHLRRHGRNRSWWAKTHRRQRQWRRC